MIVGGTSSSSSSSRFLLRCISSQLAYFELWIVQEVAGNTVQKMAKSVWTPCRGTSAYLTFRLSMINWSINSAQYPLYAHRFRLALTPLTLKSFCIPVSIFFFFRKVAGQLQEQTKPFTVMTLALYVSTLLQVIIYSKPQGECRRLNWQGSGPFEFTKAMEKMFVQFFTWHFVLFHSS